MLSSVLYLIFVGNNLETLLVNIGHGPIVAAASIPLMFVACMRSMKSLSIFAVIAQVSLLLGLTIISGYAYTEEQRNPDRFHDLNVYPTSRFAYVFGIAIYTYEGIGLALPIEGLPFFFFIFLLFLFLI